jgi:hypothetical protein
MQKSWTPIRMSIKNVYVSIPALQAAMRKPKVYLPTKHRLAALHRRVEALRNAKSIDRSPNVFRLKTLK